MNESGNGSTGSPSSGTGNGSGGNSSGNGNGSSTPFLITTHSDGSTRILNEVMKGNPTSYFFDKETGQRAFARGEVGSDTYPVALSDLAVKDGSLRFALKEIEPEESFIHELQYSFLTIDPAAALAVHNTHQSLCAYSHITPLATDVVHSTDPKRFSKDTLCRRHQGVTYENLLSDALFLRNEEYVEFQVAKDTSDPSGTVQLSVGAFWRTLLSKEAYQERIRALTEPIEKKPVLTKSRKKVFRSLIPVFSFLLSMSFGANVDNHALLEKFNSPVAHASAPNNGGRSLHFYYRTADGRFVYFATIHPRFRLVYNTVVDLPEEAFIDGVADIRTTATDDHYIYSLGVVTNAETLQEETYTELAGHFAGTSTAARASVAQPLKTTAGDHIDFSIPVPDGEYTHMLLKIHGYYVPLPVLDDHELFRWWQKLTPPERQLYLAE